MTSSTPALSSTSRVVLSPAQRAWVTAIATTITLLTVILLGALG
ncbi:hypothetical protein [Amycolatopsis acididurans]|nr:hypothetical protein [Amycolatopsis acididurans]